MRETSLGMGGAIAIAVIAAATATAQEPPQAITADRWQQTLQFAAGTGPGRESGGGERSLEIDTVWGSIDVVVHEGPGVDVIARRRIEAKSPEARAEAERDVRLLVTDRAPALRLYVDGPFRSCNCDGQGRRERRRIDYEARYDFEVRVPRDVAVTLRTVNDGHIRARGVTGRFEAHNVNGGIELHDIAGAGEARTVNGDIDVSFRSNPASGLRLTTLNGDVVARFAPRLSADVWVKTFNGDVLTDFDFSALPPAPVESERRGALRIWRTSPRTGVRIGQGGPSFEFETFNGHIRILRSES